MKNLISFVFISTAFILLSCNSTKNTTSKPITQSSEFNTINNPEYTVSLADHLRKVAGVQVSGSGPNAQVLIRGISSINSGTEPLFVVNGSSIDGGYRAVHDLIPVHNIKSIKVLKDPAETGIYGVRGANGVIEIWLK
jgi:TonB-dependent SusC/RagA subfamily outer membrane receptor